MGQTHEVHQESSAGGRTRRPKELTAEAVVSENMWKKGAVRIWSRRLRDAIGLMLGGLATSDLETIFRRSISKEVWTQLRQAIKKICSYGAWSSEKVVPLLGGNVIGEIKRALDEWADYNNQPRLDAYHLAGKERP